MSALADTLIALIREHRLVDEALLDATGLDAAQRIQQLVSRELVTKAQLLGLLAERYAMETVDALAVSPTAEALERVGHELATRYHILPLALRGHYLNVAVADPLEMEGVDMLAHHLRLRVEPRLAWGADLALVLERAYQRKKAAHTVPETMDPAGRKAFPPDEESVPEPMMVNDGDSPIIGYVHALIQEAIRRRASDIHLEPLENRFRVRLRVDGVMQPFEYPAKSLQPAILSRVKLMAGMSIAEKRMPQDGRIQSSHDGNHYDLRVASIPSVHGETIVLRVLNQSGVRLGLNELGLLPDEQAKYEQLTTLPDGMVLVTGPTGSGKSTTLYSTLHQLNQTARKIITVEDPVEYQMVGITQVPVRPELGMTFASALRAMLRQSPNVIMVGEIRDKETAEVAIHAALTGHLVLSTLHTNDAPSAVSRLVDIGIKPFLIAAALRGVLAQRLVRCICPACGASYSPTAQELAILNTSPTALNTVQLTKGKGCASCHGTGYQGRKGIFELLTITDPIRELIYNRAALQTLRSAAKAGSMRTLRENGLQKVLAGVTTLAEVMAVVGGV